jgi:hypothetical protein
MIHDPATILHSWIPSQYWIKTLQAIARSIEVAHDAGPNRWGLRLDRDSVMLKVGPHEVLQVLNGERAQHGMPFHMIVDRELIPTSLRSRDDDRIWFSKGEDCYGTRGASSYYPSDPGTEACKFKFSVLTEMYDALYDAHATVIRRAAGLPLNPATRQQHSSALVSFLAAETGYNLAQPAWVTMHEEQK